MTEAKSFKRLSAYLIDLILVTIVITLATNIRFINPTYDKYIESYKEYSDISQEYLQKEIDEEEFINKSNEAYYNVIKYGVSYNLIGSVIILLYFGVFQKYNNGQTIGKKLLKIKVVDDDNKNPKLITLLLRYGILYLPELGSVIIAISNSILIFILSQKYFFIASNIISTIIIVFSIVSFSLVILKSNHKGLHDMIWKTKVVNE